MIVIWLALSGGNQPAVVQDIAGVQDNSDPNHPREIYYGQAGLLTLADMLSEQGIRVYKEDKVTSFPDPSLGIGSKITIERAMPVVLDDAGKILIARTWENQVKDIFTEQNVILGDQDKIDPSLETWLRPEMKIVITRVAETELKEDESIPYNTIKKNDPDLEKGKTRVEQAGKNGKKVNTYIIRRENGIEVSRKLVKQEVVTEPENRLVYIGTKEVILGRGTATWYDLISGMTAAHNSLPRYSSVRVTAVNSGRSVVVKIIDRGIQGDAIIDLSADAFAQLAPLGAGVIQVVLSVP